MHPTTALAALLLAAAPAFAQPTTAPAAAAAAAISIADGEYRVDWHGAGAHPPAVGPEWSLASRDDRPTLVDTLPVDDTTFLGRFDDEDLTLALKDLPPHAFVRIALDLYVIHSWDGSLFRGWDGGPVGPDFWSMAVGAAPDGPRRNLIRATFSNTNVGPGIPRGFKVGGAIQSYPSPFSGDRFPEQSGASARNSLGYVHPQVGTVQEDATYRVVVDVPHGAATLCVTFAGDGLNPGRRDEAWGIGRIDVRTVDAAGHLASRPADAGEPFSRDAQQDPPFRLPAGDLSAAFATACNVDDPFDAADAFQQLVLGGEASVRAIRAANVPPASPVDAAAVRALVAQLADIGRTRREVPDAWAVPDPAEESLVRMGWPIEPLLASLVDQPLPLLRGNRAAQALRRIRIAPLGVGAARQRQIALHALAILDTPAARELIATLAPQAK